MRPFTTAAGRRYTHGGTTDAAVPRGRRSHAGVRIPVSRARPGAGGSPAAAGRRGEAPQRRPAAAAAADAGRLGTGVRGPGVRAVLWPVGLNAAAVPA